MIMRCEDCGYTGDISEFRVFDPSKFVPTKVKKGTKFVMWRGAKHCCPKCGNVDSETGEAHLPRLQVVGQQ